MCWAVPYYINSVYVLRIIVFAVGVYMHCIQCCNYCCLHHFEKKKKRKHYLKESDYQKRVQYRKIKSGLD